MERRSTPMWRLAARMFFVPLFAWMLLAQSILLPVAKAQAAALAGADSALAILCAPSLPLPGDAGDDTAPKKVHDFGCCTMAGRIDLDLPVATLAAPLPLIEPTRPLHPTAYVLSQGRAPPAITATPSAARAPPSHS